MDLFPLIHDLAVILGVAGLFALIFQRIRQPLVLGYLLAGLVIGPYTPPYAMVLDIPNIKIWAELGVIFLMFTLGLEFSFHKLTRVGVSAGFTACFEAILMMVLGYGTGKLLGWSPKDSLFLGAMLSISSTTIIIKALDELNLKRRRFAELIFGILIVEDLVAILILVGLSTFVSEKNFSSLTLIYSAGKLVLVIGSWFLAGYFLIPRFVKYVGRIGSEETLMILSIGLCLSLVVFAAQFHYSAALGAFIMGSILAESSESYRIEELMRPLKDLFGAVFFVSVGMLLDPSIIYHHLGSVLLIALITIVGKVVSTSIGALITGQTLRTSIQVGFGLAQIGEFSFIIAGLGLSLGVIDETLYPIGVAVSLVTTFTTPYMIRYSHSIAVRVENLLPANVRSILNRYAAWQQERKANLGLMNSFYKKCVKWLLNGILVTAIFLSIENLISPFFQAGIPNSYLSSFTEWFFSILISSPFIWAMAVSFSEKGQQNSKDRDRNQMPTPAALFLSRLLTLAWIGILSLEFISIWFIAIFTAVILVLLFVGLLRHLETSYTWFESQFLSAFENSAKTRKKADLQKELAPWDAHLNRLKVHPNSDYVLKHLANTNLRSKFGLNIIAIQRGVKQIIAPNRHELILPNDELLVLGTDEQIERVRPRVENPVSSKDQIESISGYKLTHVKLEPDSDLIGKTLRNSGIREEYESLIVGIEREGQRMLNPESDLVLQKEDIIWVVGQDEQVDSLKVSVGKAQT